MPSLTPEPGFPKSRELNLTDVELGIKKLEKRLEEISRLKNERVPHDSQQVTNCSNNIVNTIREVFGVKSSEYLDNQWFKIIHHNNIPPFADISEFETKYATGLIQATDLVQGLIAWLCEKKEFLNQDPTKKIQATFDSLDLHSRIAEACGDLFRDGHYRNAVQDGSIALIHMVKEKSHRNDITSETTLMETVFSPKSPILKFNDLQDETDKSEQLGFMFLFKGATLGIRNPRSHALNPDSQQDALEFIAFLSLLAKLVEKSTLAKKVSSPTDTPSANT
ncbi:MAG: TIGR02391 family protein [Nitrospirales bacterium]